MSPGDTDMNLLLTFDELEILLYARGFREINGIRMPEKEFDREDVLHAVMHLQEEGLIKTEGEIFRFREDVTIIVDAIGRPVSYAVLNPGPEYPVFACYFVPGRVVTTELHEYRDKTLRIRTYTMEEFAAWKEGLKVDYC